MFLLVLHWYSLFPARPKLPLFSFAFGCSVRGGVTRDRDDGDEDVMLLIELTLPLVSSYLHLFWSFCFY
jgi:hypothetical protein